MNPALFLVSFSPLECYYSSYSLGIAWYEWPIMYRGIVYHWRSLPDGYHQLVYLFGNPILFWLVLATVVVGLFYCDHLLHAAYTETISPAKRRVVQSFVLCFLGWLANYVPYPILIRRPCYMYHYHPALFFGMLLVGMFFDTISRKFKSKTAILLSAAILLAPIVASYVFFAPFSFFLPMTDLEHDRRRWFHSFFKTW